MVESTSLHFPFKSRNFKYLREIVRECGGYFNIHEGFYEYYVPLIKELQVSVCFYMHSDNPDQFSKKLSIIRQPFF